MLVYALLAALLARAAALDNGAADTPPLGPSPEPPPPSASATPQSVLRPQRGAGWCSWQRYRCAIACNDSTSTDCFNERLIRDTADAMASSGLAKAGYEYVACETRHPHSPLG